MKFVISSPSQNHSLDLVKSLQRQGRLERYFSCYTSRRLASRGITGPEITSLPLPWLAWYGLNRVIRSQKFRYGAESYHKVLIDRGVARRMPACDVFLSISSFGLESGRKAQSLGAIWVCDRPNSHILAQDEIVREEFKRHGVPWPGISRQVIERELAEYDAADAILVPSQFAARTFLERGFSPERIWRIPYGIDLSRFQPAERPPREGFSILFAGQCNLRKGVPYLLEAFARLKVTGKELILAGPPNEHVTPLIEEAARKGNVRALGAIPQTELAKLMQQADVLVLPSIEEGLALVQAQALASGCPVIGSVNSGAEDLIGEKSGYVVPIRDVEALVKALEAVAFDPNPQAARDAAVADAKRLGSYDQYAELLVEKCQRMIDARGAERALV